MDLLLQQFTLLFSNKIITQLLDVSAASRLSSQGLSSKTSGDPFLVPAPGPEVLQVVVPLLLVSPPSVEQGDGLVRRHVQPLYHVAAHHVTRPVTVRLLNTQSQSLAASK